MLGLIHSHSGKNSEGWAQLINSTSDKDWENDVEAMTDYFKMKFKQLKQR